MHEADADPRSGKIVGTADYLAPEQIRTPMNVTSTSDIYSLGCTLYYAITGKVPYPGGSPSSKAMRHCDGTPWHPQRFNSDVSEEFVEIIADMMEKDPKARIQTAAEVAARLEPWAGEEGPLLSQQLTASRWMPPPPPVEAAAEDDPSLHDTGSATFDPSELSPSGDSPSQVEQRTAAVLSVDQETRRVPGFDSVAPPPVPRSGLYGLSRAACVGIALAVAVPMSLLAGGLVGLLVGLLLHRAS
jgi:serine/threonine protein kinase